MQLLILAHAPDGGAQAVASLLAPTLGSRLTVLHPEWLGQANWSHQLDGWGRAQTRMRWFGEHKIDSHEIGGVWNRIRTLPQAAFRTSASSDRDYAGAELQALVASWLAELGERVTPVMRRHACVTPALHHLHWADAACRHGLDIVTGSGMSETYSVLRTPLEIWLPGGMNPPAPLACACHAIADELGFDLMSLGFRGTLANPQLCRVDVQSALSAQGEQLAVARWLLHRFKTAVPPAAQTLTELLAWS